MENIPETATERTILCRAASILHILNYFKKIPCRIEYFQYTYTYENKVLCLTLNIEIIYLLQELLTMRCGVIASL